MIYFICSFLRGDIRPEAEFLDEIKTKALRVFLLAIHSHLYSFALRFLILQTHATSNDFCSSVVLVVELPTYAVKEKGGKPDRKPYPLPYGLRNLYRTLKIYAQKPQGNCTFMNSASVGDKGCSVGSHEGYERCRV